MASLERPSFKSLDIRVSAVPLQKAVGQERVLDESYFDFDNFVVKDKFFSYAEPFMGTDKIVDDKYYKIIKQMRQYNEKE